MRAHAVHSLERYRRHLLAVIVSAHRQHCRRVLDPLLLHGPCVTHTLARTVHFAAAQFTAVVNQFPPSLDTIIIIMLLLFQKRRVSIVPMKYNLTVAAFCPESKGFRVFPPDYITILLTIMILNHYYFIIMHHMSATVGGSAHSMNIF